MNPMAQEAAYYASLPTKRVVASVLVSDEIGRVLLLQPSYKASWEIPGGMAGAGEPPRAAARRAVEESLGAPIGIGRLLVVDWLPEVGPKTEGLAFVYDGGTLDAAAADGIRLQRPDLNAYGFVDIDGAVGLTSERLERRIKAALFARQGGRLLELEDGWRQPLQPTPAGEPVSAE